MSDRPEQLPPETAALPDYASMPIAQLTASALALVEALGSTTLEIRASDEYALTWSVEPTEHRHGPRIREILIRQAELRRAYQWRQESAANDPEWRALQQEYIRLDGERYDDVERFLRHGPRLLAVLADRLRAFQSLAATLHARGRTIY